MSEHPNEETQKIITEGGDLGTLFAHPAWPLFEARIEKACSELDSWSSLPDNLSPTAKAKEMDRRVGAISIVRQIIQEAKGDVENAVATAKSFAAKPGEVSQILRHYPENQTPEPGTESSQHEDQ